MVHTVITWGFDPMTGKVYLDCFLKITDCVKDAAAIKMMNLRNSSQSTHLALLSIPEDCERKDVEDFIKDAQHQDVVNLLQKAKVNIRDILRKNYKSNAINFMMSKN